MRPTETKKDQILAKIRDVVVEVGADGKLSYCSPSTKEFSGYDADKEIGNDISKYFAQEEDLAKTNKAIKRALQGKGPQTVEFLYKPKKGRPFPVEATATANKERGKPTTIFAVIRDVSEQKEAEEALKKSEEKYKHLFEKSPVGIFRSTSSGRIEDLNKKMARILGCKDKEEAITGYKDLQKTLYTNKKRRKEFLEQLKKKGSTNNFEIEAKRKDKKKIHLSLKARITQKNNDGSFIIDGFAEDITTRKQAERKLESTLTVQKAIANISTKFVKTKDLDKSINGALTTLGEATGASRTYIFLFDDEEGTMTNTHEWCAQGVKPEKRRLQGLPQETFPWWLKKLRAQKTIHVPDVTKMPRQARAEKKILEAQAIKSAIVFPIIQEGTTTGFIGLDNTETKGEWDRNDLNILRTASEIIGNSMARHEKEETIKKSENKFKSYISSSPEGVFVVDKKGGYTYVNETGCKMLGYRKDEILGMTLGNLTPKSHNKISYERFKQLKRKGKLTYEGPMERKDGKTIQVQINGVTLPGERYLAFVTDITEKKESEQKLQQSEEKFKNIFNNTNDAIFIHDLTPKFIEVNDVACERLGYTKEELLKRNPKTIDAPEKTTQIRKKIAKIRKEGKASFETIHLTKDGKRIPVDITSTLIDYNGKPAILSSARDITERKALEKEREERTDQLTQKVFELEKAEKQLKKAKKDIEDFNKQLEEKVEERTKELREANEKVRDLLETKTQFVNQVAHDLRTPLTPISVLLPAVKKEAEGKLSDDDLKKLDVVINNAKYLAQLVSDTLNIARLDAGRAEFNPEPLKLKDVVKEVIDNNQVIFDEKDVKVENHIKENLPPAKADKVKLIEVFENIIMNATKFMTEDEKKLTFKAKKNKDKITIRVSDTGIGIKKEDLKKIFDEFHKVDAARHEQSSGLGLAICKRIIKQFGGDIWAESDGEGKGATIAFTLPTADKQKEE
ncbi:MAG: PAS domain S-box protein [Candidatus Woesearchaeota archaeon]